MHAPDFDLIEFSKKTKDLPVGMPFTYDQNIFKDTI